MAILIERDVVMDKLRADIEEMKTTMDKLEAYIEERKKKMLDATQIKPQSKPLKKIGNVIFLNEYADSREAKTT